MLLFNNRNANRVVNVTLLNTEWFVIVYVIAVKVWFLVKKRREFIMSNRILVFFLLSLLSVTRPRSRVSEAVNLGYE